MMRTPPEGEPDDQAPEQDECSPRRDPCSRRAHAVVECSPSAANDGMGRSAHRADREVIGSPARSDARQPPSSAPIRTNVRNGAFGDRI
jgi:hypothetical protein